MSNLIYICENCEYQSEKKILKCPKCGNKRIDVYKKKKSKNFFNNSIIFILIIVLLGFLVVGCKSCIINKSTKQNYIPENKKIEKIVFKDVNILIDYYPELKEKIDDVKIDEFFKIISLTKNEREIYSNFKGEAYGDYLNSFPDYSSITEKYLNQKDSIEYLSVFLFENGFYSKITSRKLINKYDLKEILINFSFSYDLFFKSDKKYLEKYPVIYNNKEIEKQIKWKISYFTEDKILLQ